MLSIRTKSNVKKRLAYTLPATCMSLVCALALHAASTCATEIMTWKDKDGKTHFGDKAPPGKEDVAEKVKIQHAPVNKPEKEIQKKETDYWYRHKLAKQEEQKNKQSDTQSGQKTQPSSESSELSTEQKKRFCRDTYSYNVKLRTECFNNI